MQHLITYLDESGPFRVCHNVRSPLATMQYILIRKVAGANEGLEVSSTQVLR